MAFLEKWKEEEMKLPKLCRNKTRNRAFVLERGKKIYLGKWGAPETEAAYQLYIHNLTLKLPTAPLLRLVPRRLIFSTARHTVCKSFGKVKYAVGA